MNYIIPPIPDRLSITTFKEFYAKYEHLKLAYNVGGPNGGVCMVTYQLPGQEPHINNVVGTPVSGLEVLQFLFNDGNPLNTPLVMPKTDLVVNRAYEAIQWYLDELSAEELEKVKERFSLEIERKIKTKKGNS